MSESGKDGGPVYPTTLDVVDYLGRECQVVATARAKIPSKDIFLLKDIETGKVFRVINGATFSFGKLRDPGQGDVYRRDEGVKVTGSITGGEIAEE